MELNIANGKEDEAAIKAFEKEYSDSIDLKKVSLLIDQLKDKNAAIRLHCSTKLTELGKILGPNRIEEELIPFITDLILNFEDNEDILAEFSNQLLNLLTILLDNQILSIIGIRSLEILSGNDDEKVRQTSIDNLCKVIQLIDENVILSEIFPLMKRLIDNDLKSKVSVCYLFPNVYTKIQNKGIKKELLQVYYDITHDESPSVRKAAADNIRFFAKTNDSSLLAELKNLYSYFINDPIDIVKIATIEVTKEFLEYLPEDKKEELIIEFSKVVSLEKSWRVKYSAAECICDIASSFSTSFNETKFVPILMLFLKDKEPEVRSSVLAHFEAFATVISHDKFKDSFFSIFLDLSNDTNIHVRSLYASCLLKCVKNFKSNEQFLLESVMPLVTKVLKDENSEVQFSAISEINELLFFKSDDVLMTKCFIPIITEGMNHIKWRFRYTIAEKLRLMINEFTYAKYIEYFFSILMQLFGDHADEIREISWTIIEELAKKDDKMLVEKIWPVQKEKLDSKKYIIRISMLNSIKYFMCYYKTEFIIDQILPTIFNIAQKDKVPNVKFCSCIIAKEFAFFLLQQRRADRSILKQIEDFILQFKDEKDIDVEFFSKEALKEIEKLKG